MTTHHLALAPQLNNSAWQLLPQGCDSTASLSLWLPCIPVVVATWVMRGGLAQALGVTQRAEEARAQTGQQAVVMGILR